jgi:hypothetical protein
MPLPGISLLSDEYQSVANPDWGSWWVFWLACVAISER